MQDSVKLDRDKFIGGSDIPVVMDLSPFNTRFNLLLEKAGYKENDFAGNIYTEYGQTMEPKIREYINASNMLITAAGDFVEGKTIVELQGRPLNIRCHTDGQNNIGVLEIKTTSQTFENLEDYKIYLVQLLFYMYCTQKPEGVLAVYRRPDDLDETFNPDLLQIFHVKMDDHKEKLKEITAAVDLFLDDLEKVKQNPFITEEELLPQEIPEIARQIIAFEQQLRFYKDTERKAANAKERLKNAMEANGVKTWTTPNGYKITRVDDTPEKVITKTVFNETKMQQERPRIYKQYIEEIKEIKKGRKGYIKITEPKTEEDV